MEKPDDIDTITTAVRKLDETTPLLDVWLALITRANNEAAKGFVATAHTFFEAAQLVEEHCPETATVDSRAQLRVARQHCMRVWSIDPRPRKALVAW